MISVIKKVYMSLNMLFNIYGIDVVFLIVVIFVFIGLIVFICFIKRY